MVLMTACGFFMFPYFMVVPAVHLDLLVLLLVEKL